MNEPRTPEEKRPPLKMETVGDITAFLRDGHIVVRDVTSLDDICMFRNEAVALAKWILEELRMTNDLTMGAGQGADATTAATEPVRRPGSLSSKEQFIELLDKYADHCTKLPNWVSGLASMRNDLIEAYKRATHSEVEAIDDDHVCGVCEGTQRGVCVCGCTAHEPGTAPRIHWCTQCGRDVPLIEGERVVCACGVVIQDVITAQPPAECSGCAEFVRMQHDIASVLGVDADTDSIDLHQRIYGAISSAQPPGALLNDELIVWQCQCGWINLDRESPFCAGCDKKRSPPTKRAES